MVGVLAARLHTVEVTVGFVVAAGAEGRIAHADVVLRLALRAERPVIHLGEGAGRSGHVARRAVVRCQREKHVVAEDRTGPPLHETLQRPLGIPVAQLDGAGRQIELDLLAFVAVVGREPLLRPQKFVAGVVPAAVVEQLDAAVDESEGFGFGGAPRTDAEEPRDEDRQDDRIAAHRYRYIVGQRYEFFSSGTP